MQLRAWRTVTFTDCTLRAVGTSLSDHRQTSSRPLQPPQGTVGNARWCKLDAEPGASEAAVSWCVPPWGSLRRPLASRSARGKAKHSGRDGAGPRWAVRLRPRPELGSARGRPTYLRVPTARPRVAAAVAAAAAGPGDRAPGPFWPLPSLGVGGPAWVAGPGHISESGPQLPTTPRAVDGGGAASARRGGQAMPAARGAAGGPAPREAVPGARPTRVPPS